MSKNKLMWWMGLSLALWAFCGQVWAASEVGFNDPGFATTWERTDKVVAEASGTAGRGYSWGPPAPGTLAITTEPYNGTSRIVQYFDKARTEVNNPAADRNSLYYVTTGLLVKEMVSGLRQDGDNSFTRQTPGSAQVAGDSNQSGANAVAPTYASFRAVATIDPQENRAVASPNKLINTRLNKNGQTQPITPTQERFLADYDSVTGHNIADVFSQFADQTGPIWNGSSYVQDKVFFGNPLYVLGRPITEPFWVRAEVGGTEKDVMVQLFERRALTYTPSNPDAYKVEMGNVGQHYFTWRYLQNHNPATSYAPSDFSQYLAAYQRFNTAVPQGGLANARTYTPPPFVNDGQSRAAELGRSPVLSNDGKTVIIGSTSGLQALDSETLALKWRFPAQPTYNNGAYPDLTVCGNILIARDEAQISALRLTDGALLWQYPTLENGPAICDGFKIYFTYYTLNQSYKGSGRLVALDLNNGSFQWQVIDQQAPYTDPIFGPNGNIYVATNSHLLAFDPTGKPVSDWNTALPTGIIAVRPAYAEGKFFVIGQPLSKINYALYVVDSSGKLIDQRDLLGYANTAPAVSGGVVYVYNQIYISAPNQRAYNRLLGLSVNDLSHVILDVRLDQDPNSALAVVNGFIYYVNFTPIFGPNDPNSSTYRQEVHQLEIANPTNNRVMLSIEREYGRTYNPLVANNRVYVSGRDGKFYALK